MKCSGCYPTTDSSCMDGGSGADADVDAALECNENIEMNL